MIVQIVDPPEKGYFGKLLLSSKGFPIKCHTTEDDSVLFIARDRIDKMFQGLDHSIIKTLHTKGLTILLVRECDSLIDVPYLEDIRDDWIKNNKTNRGVRCRHFAAVGAENLLGKTPNDMLIHELAHAVMDLGIPWNDEIQTRVQQSYEQNKEKWNPYYASTNKYEYFAEATMYYFGGKGAGGPPVGGPIGLLELDPSVFGIIGSIFSGRHKVTPLQDAETILESTPLPPDSSSLSSSEVVQLRVQNSSPTAVTLSWLNWDKQLVVYSTIEPDDFIHQPTFVDHVWKIGNKYYVAKYGGEFRIEFEA